MSTRIGACTGSAWALFAATVLLGCAPVEQSKTDLPSASASGMPLEARVAGKTGRDARSPGSSLGRAGEVKSGRQSRDDSDLSAAEMRMREQSRNLDRTVWEGVLIGAAGGAVWGLIGGGSASDMLRDAAIGAAVGGLSGAYMAQKQKQYADKEDQLEAMILDVRESNEDVEAFIASVREVLAEDRRRLAATERRYKQGVASYEELEREKARDGANRSVVEKAVGGAKQKYTMFKGAKDDYEKQNPSTDTQRFQRELKAYNEHIEALDDLAESMGVA